MSQLADHLPMGGAGVLPDADAFVSPEFVTREKSLREILEENKPKQKKATLKDRAETTGHFVKGALAAGILTAGALSVATGGLNVLAGAAAFGVLKLAGIAGGAALAGGAFGATVHRHYKANPRFDNTVWIRSYKRRLLVHSAPYLALLGIAAAVSAGGAFLAVSALTAAATASTTFMAGAAGGIIAKGALAVGGLLGAVGLGHGATGLFRKKHRKSLYKKALLFGGSAAAIAGVGAFAPAIVGALAAGGLVSSLAVPVAGVLGAGALVLKDRKKIFFKNQTTNHITILGMFDDHLGTVMRPGLKVKLPWWNIDHSVSTQVRKLTVEDTLNCITSDYVTVQIPLSMIAHIKDAGLVVYNTNGDMNEGHRGKDKHKLADERTEKAENIVTDVASEAVKSVVGNMTFKQFVSSLKNVNDIVCEVANEDLAQIGYELDRVYLNNYKIHPKLQEAMDGAIASFSELIKAQNEAKAARAYIGQKGEGFRDSMGSMHSAFQDVVNSLEARGMPTEGAFSLAKFLYSEAIKESIGENGNMVLDFNNGSGSDVAFDGAGGAAPMIPMKGGGGAARPNPARPKKPDTAKPGRPGETGASAKPKSKDAGELATALAPQPAKPAGTTQDLPPMPPAQTPPPAKAPWREPKQQ